MLLELSAVARAFRNTLPMLIAFFGYGAGEGKWWIKLREAQSSSSPFSLGLAWTWYGQSPVNEPESRVIRVALTGAVLESALAKALLLPNGFAAFELLARHGLVLWQGLEPAWLSQATQHPQPVSSSVPALASGNSSCGFLLLIFPGLARSIDKCDFKRSHAL